MAEGGVVKALCLAAAGPKTSTFVAGDDFCEAFARNSHGAVDDPPNYGEIARAAYEKETALRYPNGAPVFAPDGTLLDSEGNRSIFDDVDL